MKLGGHKPFIRLREYSTCTSTVKHGKFKLPSDIIVTPVGMNSEWFHVHHFIAWPATSCYLCSIGCNTTAVASKVNTPYRMTRRNRMTRPYLCCMCFSVRYDTYATWHHSKLYRSLLNNLGTTCRNCWLYFLNYLT